MSHMQSSFRHFSNDNKSDADKKKSESQASYEKSFEEMFSKSKQPEMDKQTKESLEEQLRLKKIADAEFADKYEKDKAEFQSRKQQDFEDLLSGETKKRKEDMNLQGLFKEYYSQIKTVEAKDYVNSAKSSLNSFSSLLEKRRQKASQK